MRAGLFSWPRPANHRRSHLKQSIVLCRGICWVVQRLTPRGVRIVSAGPTTKDVTA